MILKPDKIIPRKVTINVGENINTFLCTGCNREIAASKKFIIDREKYREFNIIQSNGKSYLKCVCGFFYEVIKCLSREFENGLKFKEVLIVEEI